MFHRSKNIKIFFHNK